MTTEISYSLAALLSKVQEDPNIHATVKDGFKTLYQDNLRLTRGVAVAQDHLSGIYDMGSSAMEDPERVRRRIILALRDIDKAVRG